MTLQRRDKLFCDEYIIDFDGPRAARAVGVPKRNSSDYAYRWLARPEIIEEVQRLLTASLAKQQVTQETIMEQYAKIAFADRRKLVDDDGMMKNLGDLDENLAACVEGYAITKNGVEIKTASRLAALRGLGEAINFFKQHEENKAPRFTITIAGKEAEL